MWSIRRIALLPEIDAGAAGARHKSYRSREIAGRINRTLGGLAERGRDTRPMSVVRVLPTEWGLIYALSAGSPEHPIS